MEKKVFVMYIRNVDTGELRKKKSTAYTFDEAEDKLLNRVSHPWVFARFETLIRGLVK